MLSSLCLTHFRGYSYAGVDFDPGVNCLVGDNGQGKTNLLEAAYYLSLLRSFRTSNINDLRQFEADNFYIRGEVCEGTNMKTQLSVGYGLERQLRVNNTPVYRSSDFINKFVCVTFIPQDLSLVQGIPAERRRFLDIAVTQWNGEYIRHLQAYHQALKSRNVMLRDSAKYPREIVTAYDTVLSREGGYIEGARMDFICRLNEELLKYSTELLGDSRIISVNYLMRKGFMMQENKKTAEEIAVEYKKLLDKNYEHDVKEGSTSVGPHRSDFMFLLNHVIMEKYCSQGECRMASLALKLAAMKVIQSAIGNERMTLLIDDVIGELDQSRRKHFFQVIGDAGQILFAVTEVPKELQKIDRCFYIRGGNIQVMQQ